MPWFSFHGGHSSEFCRHAGGRLEEIVQKAYEAGFTSLGVSEHAPRFRQGDLYHDEQDLTPGDLLTMFEAYRVRARELQKEYAGRMEMFVGFESEMMPPPEVGPEANKPAPHSHAGLSAAAEVSPEAAPPAGEMPTTNMALKRDARFFEPPLNDGMAVSARSGGGADRPKATAVVGNWAGRMKELKAKGKFDYVVGSVHSVGDYWIDYSPQATAEAAEALGGVEALRGAYFRQVVEMIEDLRPAIVGHLDLIRKFDGQHPEFSKGTWLEIDRALQAAHAYGCVLDVNAAPARRGLGPIYPMKEILRKACAMGVRVTLGDDSHGPADVGVGLDQAVKMIGEAGYRCINYLARWEGSVVWEEAPIETVYPAK
ncbi:MAG: histidinol-phosphatase [Phycisphaeraceae bacterium]|nr:histidinol-phosphatase [Phycisphaeraceae bacterium]